MKVAQQPGFRWPWASILGKTSISSSMHGCAGRRPDNDAFLAACLSDLSAPHRLRRLRPRQLATLLRSLVHLGAHPGEDWLTDLDMCCYCHPGPFDPASATAVLAALAALSTANNAATHTTISPSTDADNSNATLSARSSRERPSDADDDGAEDACAAYWGESRYPADLQMHQRSGHSKSQLQLRSGAHHYMATAAATASTSPNRRLSSSPRTSSSFWTSTSKFSADTAAARSSAAAAAPAGGGDESGPQLRFPQAVYLRLIQGGVYNYTYEQLGTLLQSFRSLGVAISDEEALMVGSRMAALLLEMGPEQRQRALAAVLGAA
ncbi:hypothetical protein VOLCADRAFT_97513 [Volvox carteri f. nagariensis]|uniref:Uncharacterized protein n=1 Tax=Volvox carteri f. nagariensis TaxID=3068 RepID=D8UCX7_VOLCA|nr:uncharacterized protein VOLCADRAFT_97513 [Volvox carteri f. nagariensis]EFJ42467.1 hypothetical protein VOLCADRAFT_97513 [Volvox carteri f. nagariensis]|eukprot:XP_002956530.1 hypothetical protein VOLCADRAFT_97513 [Volvox carteri f. nagariensis]